jgi:hypothetical protein
MIILPILLQTKMSTTEQLSRLTPEIFIPEQGVPHYSAAPNIFDSAWRSAA